LQFEQNQVKGKRHNTYIAPLAATAASVALIFAV